MLTVREEHMPRVIQCGEVALVPYLPEYVNDERLTQHVAWLNDREHMRFSEQRHRKHTKKSCAEWIASHDFRSSFVWSIETPSGYCGHVTAYGDLQNGTIDVGIMLGADHAGFGYGQQAFAGAVNCLLAEGWYKVECGTMESNKAMIRVALAAGMHFEGVRPAHFKLEDGRRVGLCLFGKSWSDVLQEQADE